MSNCHVLSAVLTVTWSPDAEKAVEPDASMGNTEGEDMKAEEAGVEQTHPPNGMPEKAKPDPASAPATEEAPQTYEEQLGQLDLQLTYLWRVHGVDYYAGREHAEPEAYDACASSKRMLRCTRPEEGEQPIKEEGVNFIERMPLCLVCIPGRQQGSASSAASAAPPLGSMAESLLIIHCCLSSKVLSQYQEGVYNTALSGRSLMPWHGRCRGQAAEGDGGADGGRLEATPGSGSRPL